MANPYAEEANMWNKTYQRSRNAAYKRERRYVDCCDLCIMGFLKHLIHAFILILIVSFGAMLVVI